MEEKKDSDYRTLDDVIAELPESERKAIEARTDELIQEYKTITELRKVRNKTQVEVAKTLNVQQSTISRLEKQKDMKLATLRHYIEAIGGELELVAKFPDKGRLTIKGFENL